MHNFIHNDNQERLTKMGFGISTKPYNPEEHSIRHWSKNLLDLHKYRSTGSLRDSREDSESLRLQTDNDQLKYAEKLSSELKYGSKTLINNRLRVESSKDLPDIAYLDRSSN